MSKGGRDTPVGTSLTSVFTGFSQRVSTISVNWGGLPECARVHTNVCSNIFLVVSMECESMRANPQVQSVSVRSIELCVCMCMCMSV